MSGIIGGAGSKSGVIGTTEQVYEEGTWTPHMYFGGSQTSTTPSSAMGRYIREGNRLFLTFYWYKSGTVSGSGQINVKNLPFVSTNYSTVAGFPSLTVGYNNHSGTVWQADYPSRLQLNGSDTLEFYGKDTTKTEGGTVELSAYGYLFL